MIVQRSKGDLYALDLSDAVWLSAPGSTAEDRFGIAKLPGGAVALRNPADSHGTVLRYTAAEWEAFERGVRDGEFGPTT
ncbi:DUF397 domain-containing protein [Streptomyces sp. 7-21]|nr:DUF397 domain-containing protein [Streptomyces sp. 7-21]